jgi:C2 domain
VFPLFFAPFKPLSYSTFRGNMSEPSKNWVPRAGWMRKQGDDLLRQWKTRFFVLAEDPRTGLALSYSKQFRDPLAAPHDKSAEIQGEIEVRRVTGVQVIPPEDAKAEITRVDVKMSSGRVFHLEVDDKHLSNQEKAQNAKLPAENSLFGGKGVLGFADSFRKAVFRAEEGGFHPSSSSSTSDTVAAASDDNGAPSKKGSGKAEQSYSDSEDLDLARLSQDGEGGDEVEGNDVVFHLRDAETDSDSDSNSNISSVDEPKNPVSSLGGLRPEWTQGVKQNVQVRVHIIEARELMPRDSNGMSDPVCTVSVFGKKQSTETYYKTTSALWDHFMKPFEAQKVTRTEFEQATLTIRVDDANTILRDVEIGSFDLDLATIYAANSKVGKKNFPHEIFRRWIALADSTSKEEGVQGYLKLSVSVLIGDDKPGVHDPADDEADYAGGKSLQSLLIQNPRIKTYWSRLRVSAYRAIDLPALDRGLGGKSDPFVQVLFGNRKVDSAIIKRNLNPEWNQSLGLRCDLSRFVQLIPR